MKKIEDNEPPDPKANDRNDLFQMPEVPAQTETQILSWGVWSASWHTHWEWISNWEWTGTRWVDNGQWVDNGWYDFTFNRYSAKLNAVQSITPDSKVPTAVGNKMKSGYGFNTSLECSIETNAPKRAYTEAQTTQMFSRNLIMAHISERLTEMCLSINQHSNSKKTDIPHTKAGRIYSGVVSGRDIQNIHFCV